MSSLADIMTIARSGILTHQKRLDIISQNITNVNTPGYHRQKAILGTSPPIAPTALELRNYAEPTGVTLVTVVREYNRMKEALLREQTSDMNLHSQKSAALQDLEALMMGDGNNSLATQIQAFWNAWQDVANNPDLLSFRSVLIEKGAALADSIRMLDGRINDYRSSIAGGVGPYYGAVVDQVDEVNGIATEIQDLNERIRASQYGANDLMDRRDELVRQLSEKVNINVGLDYEITMNLAGGGTEVLVSADGATRNTLTVTSVASPVTLSLNGSIADVSGGTVGGWVSAADIADSLSTVLDTLASELMSSVNAIHNSATAYDLDGNPSAENFFSGSDASDIAVNSAIHDASNPLNDNPRLIAAAASANPGDGAKALEIADLAFGRLAGLGNQTCVEYFNSIIAALGAEVQSEADLTTDGDAMVKTLTDSLQSETGVNLDEEMIEMVSAQKAYAASTKLFMTVDGMMDTILSLVR